MTWHIDAACRGIFVDRFYLAVFQPLALATCKGCPVQVECLTEALLQEKQGERFGVRGGASAFDRDQMHRRMSGQKLVTHCPAGHVYAEHGYLSGSGSLGCAACSRRRDQAYRDRKKAS